MTLHGLQAFFANPAKAYFEQALRLHLEDPRAGHLPDAETFEAAGLLKYQCDQLLLDGLLDGTPVGDARRRLSEVGWIPFGAAGAAFVQARRAELEGFLATSLAQADGRTIRSLLEAQRESPAAQVTVELADATLTGGVRTLPHPAGTVQVFARYTETKAKDSLRAWLAHLLGHAAGLGPFTTWGIGAKQGKPVFVAIPPLAASAAATSLSRLTAMQRVGQTSVLPFAPACSLAFADAVRRGKDVTAALETARSEWLGSPYSRGDSADLHLQRAWGDAGPMAAAGFQDAALRFWAPLLDLLHGAPSSTEDSGLGTPGGEP